MFPYTLILPVNNNLKFAETFKQVSSSKWAGASELYILQLKTKFDLSGTAGGVDNVDVDYC